MTNCTVNFGEGEWTLCFAAGKEFYQIPAQYKLADLEAAAKKISGQTIKFKLASAQENTMTPSAKPASVTPVTKKENSAKETSAPVAEISAEEPFVAASFEKDAIAENSFVSAEDAPEEVRGVLEIISGELIG